MAFRGMLVLAAREDFDGGLDSLCAYLVQLYEEGFTEIIFRDPIRSGSEMCISCIRPCTYKVRPVWKTSHVFFGKSAEVLNKNPKYRHSPAGGQNSASTWRIF